MNGKSGPKAATQVSPTSSTDHQRTARARLEAAQVGLCAGVLDPQWDPDFVIRAAIRLIDAALRDLVVI